LRSDNGLVARRYGLGREYITPYAPEQNGMIERFFLTLKQECVWLQPFENRDHAFRMIADWLDRYDADRPYSALSSLTPKEYREKSAV
jgi:putative transposase